ncbi:MAG: pilus assembly protein [Deltaproteobacteria bacterium CG11_big_fil_rev_8_21_14_0_20_45_16]|nr:MAG: pilus assembly protein [Deltaproteobacteria bacterium CG11_big_fil_rev_8_21_14_0_20_45_16]
MLPKTRYNSYSVAIIDSDTTRAFLGPILEFLDDDTVSEILINAPDVIYIERKGRLYRAESVFETQDALMAAARNVAQFVGRRIDEKHPILDARLPDGSRIHIVVPPAAKDGVYIAIRKFGSEPLLVKDMIQGGAISVEMARFLHMAVQLKKNLIVSGSTSSGKTTLLNAISSFIPDEQRVVVIEDASELQLQQEHVLRMETVNNDKLHIEIRDLVKSSLRLRPDRIVIGEVRGPEALDLLQAMNTGHSGSMATLHANNPKQALARLETLIMMNRLEMPLIAIRSQIANAIQIIVQASRLRDGSRKITHISEVTGLDEDGNYLVNDIFVLEILGIEGEDEKLVTEFRATGHKPSFLEEAKRAGIKVPDTMFVQKRKAS